jgi:hypothetical protein
MGCCATRQTRIKSLVWASCLHDRQLVHLHGAGNCSPTCYGGGARASGLCRVSLPTHQSELGVGGGGACARRRLVMRGGDLSCAAETCRERRRLVVRGGDLSCVAETFRARQRHVVRGVDLSEGIPLVRNWLEMLPTGQKCDILLTWVFTRVLSLPRLES